MFRFPEFAQTSTSRRALGTVMSCLAAAAVVSGCGGGTKVKSFQPTQIIAFGDESSAFDTVGQAVNGSQVLKGLRYTINAELVETTYCDGSYNAVPCTTPTTVSTTNFIAGGSPAVYNLVTSYSGVDPRKVYEGQEGSVSSTTLTRYTSHSYFCTPTVASSYGIWVQTVANTFGSSLSFGGDYCSQDTGSARSYAAWGYKVADVATQIDAAIARGELVEGVLVLILAGQNDIMAQYDAVVASTATEDAAKIILRDQGAALAAAINRIVATGAKVAYLTVPDMGKSPKAVAASQTVLASALTRAFNDGYKGVSESRESGGLVLSVVNDGHKVVKVDTFTQINLLAASYPTVGACDGAAAKLPNGASLASSTAELKLLNCSSQTLISGATLISHLWADDTHLSPAGHANIANLVLSRVANQL